MRRFGWRVAALCVAVAGFAYPQTLDTSLLEQRVVAVRVVDSERGTTQNLPSHFPLQPGMPFRAETARESLRELYKTGRYADIEVSAMREAEGVRVDFHVRENYYFDAVRITGLKEERGKTLALSAMRLGLGEPYRDIDLREAEERLREGLRAYGLYDSKIEIEKHPEAATRRMGITVHVEPGPQARIGNIEVNMLDGSPPGELLRRSKLKPGKGVETERLERGEERLRKVLVKNGHLGARVNARRGDYDPASKTIPLTLDVFAGPKVKVEVVGAKVSSRTLKKLIPVYQEGAVDEDLLQEGRRNLRDLLEAQGYFESQVKYETHEDTEKGQQVIHYHVELGARRRLVGFAFEGNKYFSNEILRTRVHLIPAGTLSRGRFSRRLMEDDADSLRELYVANGFREVHVLAEQQENYLGQRGDLFVRFRVEEGPQTVVAELKIEGNQALSTDYLLEQGVNSEPRQPYSQYNVLGDRDNILALYFNEGFPEARFSFEATEASEPNRVRLLYRIHEGPQIRVKEIVVSGTEHTRADTIEKELKVQPNAPLRQGELIESQRRLYNMGIFSRAQIAPQNPSGTDTDKTLIVLVEEAKRYTIAYGGGVEVQRLGGAANDPVGRSFRASPRGLLEFSKANMAGRGHTLSLKARASTLQYRFLGSYLAPNFLSRPSFSLELSAYAEKASDVRTFTARKYEAGVQLIQRISPRTTLGYRYGFRRVLVDANSLKVDPLSIPLFSQPTKISYFGAAWIRDHRDNPAEATAGDFSSLEGIIAAKTIGATANFLRIQAQNSTFHPLGKLTFARSTRFGAITRFAGSQTFDIPLPEKLYAGGGNSLRGFGFNQAGPRTLTGYPIGGEMLLALNQELRFPMRLPFIKGRLGGAIFYDAGNVFSSVENFTFRTSPRPQPLGMGDFFSHAVGLSFRYGTPIGPVRLDFGYLLNNVRFQFSDPTNNTIQSTKLPRFQFFFNIGSMF